MARPLGRRARTTVGATVPPHLCADPGAVRPGGPRGSGRAGHLLARVTGKWMGQPLRVAALPGVASTVLGLALLSACGPTYTVPPITPQPTGERHVGKWVWFDLLTHDAEAAGPR